MYRHLCIHIYGKHGAVIPGKEGLEGYVIVWNLTTQFSGQIHTVDRRGLIIIVSLMKIFKYIHLFNQLMFFIMLQSLNVAHWICGAAFYSPNKQTVMCTSFVAPMTHLLTITMYQFVARLRHLWKRRVVKKGCHSVNTLVHFQLEWFGNCGSGARHIFQQMRW